MSISFLDAQKNQSDMNTDDLSFSPDFHSWLDDIQPTATFSSVLCDWNGEAHLGGSVLALESLSSTGRSCMVSLC